MTLHVDHATIPEGAGTATVTATLSDPSTFPVTIELGYGGTAAGGGIDYTVSGSQVVIPAGSTTGTVAVTAVDDALDEDGETVLVGITNVTNAIESTAQEVTTTITDDDASPTVTLGVNNPSIAEDGGVATVHATLSEISGRDVTVDLDFAGSAGSDGVDYMISGSQILIPAGSTTGTITITAVDDALDETDETVVVDVETVTNGSESGTQQVTTTILDDDPAPAVTLVVDTTSIAELGGVATVTTALDQPSGLDVIVDLGFGGTASGDGVDYTASGTQMVIPAGSTTGTVTIAAVDDTLDEVDETVIVDIADVTNGAESGTQQVTTTITDDDTVGITINPLSGTTISEAGEGAAFAVTLASQPTAPVTITFSHDSNVQVTPSTLTFQPDSYSSQTITVTAVDDQLAEGFHRAAINLALATDDQLYQGLVIDEVLLMVKDNDPGDMFDRPDAVDLGEDWIMLSRLAVDNSTALVTGNVGAQLALFDGSDATETDGIVVAVDVDLGTLAGHAGLVARATADGLNMYLGALCYDGSFVTAQIWRCSKGLWSPLNIQHVPSQLRVGRLELEVADFSVTLRFNGEDVAHTFDGSLAAAGLVGLRGTQGSRFDNFVFGPKTMSKVSLPHSEDFNHPDGPLPEEWTSRVNHVVQRSGRAETEGATDSCSVATLNTESKHADVVVEADVALRLDLAVSHAGLVARYNGDLEGTMYLGALVKMNDQFQGHLWISKDGIWRNLVSENLGAVIANSNFDQGRLSFHVHGNVLQLALNGQVLATTTNDELTRPGYVGLRASNGESFDNFSATASTNPPTVGPLTVISGGFAAETAARYRATLARSLAVDTNLTTTNVVVEANVSLRTDLPSTHAGLVARCDSSGSSMYLGALVKLEDQFQAHLWLKTGGVWTPLQVVSLGPVAQNPNFAEGQLRFHVHGNTLQLSLNGLVLATTTNNELTLPGFAGIRGDAGESFENLGVTPSVSPPITVT